MKFTVYRDCDQRLRLRKVVMAVEDDTGRLLDRRRMFAGPGFARRLARRKAEMLAAAQIMLDACK